MPRRAKDTPVETRPCLGWCGKKIPFRDAADRYCAKCRSIKESRQRGMSRMEGAALQTSGVASSDLSALLGD